MNRRQFTIGCSAAALLGGGLTARQTETSPLITADYEELGRLVRRQTGKVVLVDLWRHD